MQILLHRENVKWLGDMDRYVSKTGDFESEFDFIAQVLAHQQYLDVE